MNNLVIAPLLLPLLAGIVMMLIPRHIGWQRLLAAITALAMLAVSLLLIKRVTDDGIQVLYVGGWDAPYGITLVVDMLAALLLATTAVVALACVLYAFGSIGAGRERHFAYPFMLFLVAGVNGSFITGDIFNLFVCFEVMLVASYVLISLGGEKIQLRESIKYIVINMVSSTLFFVAIAYIYSITGALNLAHLSERVAMAGQSGLLTAVSLLFLVIFGTKSALLLYFWLPGSYGVPAAPVAALFGALLTKVGIYTILRTFTLVFHHQPHITHTVLIWMAALTMIFGALGAISHWDIRKIMAYNIVVSVGFIVLGIAIRHPTALAGALYYLMHDMVAKALLYILGGTIISIAGTAKLRDINGLILFRPWLGWLFFVCALAVAGVPPLSGFVGKLMILQGGVAAEYYWMTGIGLLTSLLVLYSLIKVFIQSFWGETLLSEGEEKSSGQAALAPGLILTACIVGLGLGAGSVMGFVDQATAVMVDPTLYIDAVLGRTGAGVP